MAFVFAHYHFDMLKATVRERVPDARSSHCDEAIARGLGYRTYAALKASLFEGNPEIKVNEAAFAAFLKERGGCVAPADLIGSCLREFEEMESFARRERLSSLPETIDEVFKILDTQSGFEEDIVEVWAGAIGAVKQCAICSTSIVQPEDFGIAMAEHYGLAGDEADDVAERLEVEATLRASESGPGGEGGEICSYHDHIMSKDD